MTSGSSCATPTWTVTPPASQVDVVMSTGGPFDSSEYAEEHTFRLTRAGDEWLITGEPWPMFACAKEG